MKKSKFTERQVIAILNEHARGKKAAVVCRDHGISKPTFYQWKSKYSGMDVSQLKRVKELEALVAHYKKVVTHLILDIEVLKDLISKNDLRPTDKRQAVAYSTQEHSISIRRACKLLGTHSSLILYRPKTKNEVSLQRPSSLSTRVGE
jgi:putative transposase